MKMSRREISLLIIAIMLISGLIYYYAFFSPYSTRVSSVEKSITEADETNKRILDQESMINKLNKDLDALKDKITNNEQVVSNGFNLPETLSYLQNALQGCSNVSIVFNDAIIDPIGYQLQPISLQFGITGYDSLYAVLNHLQSDKYLVQYESVKIDADSQNDSGSSFRPSTADTGSNMKVTLQLQIFCTVKK